MDFLSQSAALLAFVTFALGVSVWARKPSDRLNVWFGVMCFWITAWAVFFFLSSVWSMYSHYRIHLILNLGLGPVGLRLVRYLVRERRFGHKLEYFSWAIAILLGGALALGMEERSAMILHLVYFAPSLLLVRVLQVAWSERDRALRRLWVYLGAIGAMIFCCMDHIPAMGRILPGVGNLILAVYLFFLAHRITRSRMLSAQKAASRFMVMVLMAGILTAVYSLMFAWIDGKPALFLLNSLVISFLLIMMISPFEKAAEWLVYQVQGRRYQLLRRLVEIQVKRVMGSIDASGVYREIIETIYQALSPEWIALYVLRPDGTTFKRVSSKGKEPADAHAPLEVMRDFALADDLRQRIHKNSVLPVLWATELRSELSRSLSKTDRDRASSSDQALSLLGCDAAMGLYHSGQLYGFVAVRAQPQWSEFVLLDPFLSAAGAGLANLGVFQAERERERLVELGEMAAGLAHEIRNPLGVIRGAAQVLTKDPDSKNDKLLQAIVKETDRMNGVVSQFLEYARPNRHDHQELELSQVIRSAMQPWEDLERNGVIQFVGQTDEIWVLGSEIQLVQVIRNLIQNSLQSVQALSQNPGYSPKIRVELDIADDERSPRAVIHVFDNGPGIQQENMNKIFVPFFTTKVRGTGLGLSVSQRIMLAHRGRIEVQSESGKFARFSLIFPVSERKGSKG